MLRRLLPLALALGLLVPSLPGGVAGKGGHGKSVGIAVQSASYDAGTGEVTATVRWNRRDLAKDGRDELHVVVHQGGGDSAVLHDLAVAAAPGKHRRTYRIALSPAQREAVGDGSHLTVVATHKHDEDGGLFDRASHDRRPVDAGAARYDDNFTKCDTIGPGLDLSFCLLNGANLADVDLHGANLTAVDLSDTKLSGANLSDTNLTDWANLSGADASGANFTRADMTNAYVYFSKFIGANLTDVNLTGAILGGSDFSDTNQTGTIFCNTMMPDGSINNAGCQGGAGRG